MRAFPDDGFLKSAVHPPHHEITAVVAVNKFFKQLDILVHRLPVGIGVLFSPMGHLEVPFLYNGRKIPFTCIFGVVQDALGPGLVPLPAAREILHQLGGKIGCDLAQRFPAQVCREHGLHGLAFLWVYR